MVRFQVILDPTEASLLAKWAESEMRDPREQLRFILRQELERRGLLLAQMQTKQPEPTANQGVQDACK